MTSLLSLMVNHGARRAVAALVIAAMPVLYSVSGTGMSYAGAWYGLTEGSHGFATIILGAGMTISCALIPLAQIPCALLTTL